MGDIVETKILSALERRRSNRLPGQDPRPITARVLARAFGISQSSGPERQRRAVRKIIKRLRDDGHADIMSDGGGYWLAVEQADLERHAEYHRKSGIQSMAVAGLPAKAPVAQDMTGQLQMFPHY